MPSQQPHTRKTAGLFCLAQNIPGCFHRPISAFINLGSIANSPVDSHLKIDSLTFRSFVSFASRAEKGFATAPRARKRLNGRR